MTERDTRIGHIVRLGGGVADIRFAGALPAISNRLVTLTDPEIVIEVAGLPGEALQEGALDRFPRVLPNQQDQGEQ